MTEDNNDSHYYKKIKEQLNLRESFLANNRFKNELHLGVEQKNMINAKQIIPKMSTIAQSLQYIADVNPKMRVSSNSLSGGNIIGRPEKDTVHNLSIITSGESSPCDSDVENQIKSLSDKLSYEECVNLIIDSSLIKYDQAEPQKVQKTGVHKDWQGIKELIIFNMDRKYSYVNNKSEFEDFIKNSLNYAFLKFNKFRFAYFKGFYSAFIKFDNENSAQFTHFNIMSKISHFKQKLGAYIDVYRVKENKSRKPPRDSWVGVLLRNLPQNYTMDNIKRIIDTKNIDSKHIEELAQIGKFKYSLVVVKNIESAESLIQTIQAQSEHMKYPAKASIHELSAKKWYDKHNSSHKEFFLEKEISHEVKMLSALKKIRKEEQKKEQQRKQEELEKQEQKNKEIFEQQQLLQQQEEQRKKEEQIKFQQELQKQIDIKLLNNNELILQKSSSQTGTDNLDQNNKSIRKSSTKSINIEEEKEIIQNNQYQQIIIQNINLKQNTPSENIIINNNNNCNNNKIDIENHKNLDFNNNNSTIKPPKQQQQLQCESKEDIISNNNNISQPKFSQQLEEEQEDIIQPPPPPPEYPPEDEGLHEEGEEGEISEDEQSPHGSKDYINERQQYRKNNYRGPQKYDKFGYNDDDRYNYNKNKGQYYSNNNSYNNNRNKMGNSYQNYNKNYGNFSSGGPKKSFTAQQQGNYYDRRPYQKKGFYDKDDSLSNSPSSNGQNPRFQRQGSQKFYNNNNYRSRSRSLEKMNNSNNKYYRDSKNQSYKDNGQNSYTRYNKFDTQYLERKNSQSNSQSKDSDPEYRQKNGKFHFSTTGSYGMSKNKFGNKDSSGRGWSNKQPYQNNNNSYYNNNSYKYSPQQQSGNSYNNNYKMSNKSNKIRQFRLEQSPNMKSQEQSHSRSPQAQPTFRKRQSGFSQNPPPPQQ